MNVTMSEAEFNETVVREHFTSPSACYDTLRQHYGAGTSEGEEKYLFRGESRYYPTSTPGTYRVLTADYPMPVKFARIDATGLFVEGYEEAGNDRDVGECLAQHYLSTSDGLDFSASLGVALAFALDERGIDVPRTAYIAVLDHDAAGLSDRFDLRDLRGLGASRPDRQCGFVAVHHAGNFVDLKDSECRRELRLIWYSFTVDPDDIIHNRHRQAPRLDSLYDIWGDPWAENMIQHLSDLIANPSPQWGKEGLEHLIGARNALLSRTGNLLICTGRDGVERAFEHDFEKDQFEETWHFRVQTVPPQPDGEAFDLSVTALDGATVRQVMLAHHDNPAYAAMGIPDALIPVVAATLGKKVVSSPTTADDAGVYRTVAATKVWNRLVAKGVATFDPAADVYAYTGP